MSKDRLSLTTILKSDELIREFSSLCEKDGLKSNFQLYKNVTSVIEGSSTLFQSEAEKLIDPLKSITLKSDVVTPLTGEVEKKSVSKETFYMIQKEIERTLSGVLANFAPIKGSSRHTSSPRSSMDRVRTDEKKGGRKSLRELLSDILTFECFGGNDEDESGQNPIEKQKSIRKFEWKVVGKDIDEATHIGQDCPKLFSFLVEYLLKNDCHQIEGIFRVSGRKNLIENLLLDLDQGVDVDYDKYRDINIFACVLKQYLRSLPNPLLTYDLYPEFLKAFSVEEDKQIDEIKRLLRLLSKPRLTVLRMLLELLVKISANQKESMMGTSNLAVVFAVTLMKPKENTLEVEMSNAQQVTRIMEEMIINYDRLKDVLESTEQMIEIETKSEKLEELECLLTDPVEKIEEIEVNE